MSTTALLSVLLCAILAVCYADQAPGGFIEKSFAQNARRDNFDLSFVPSTRGTFDFPMPYYTKAYRITDESDGSVLPNGNSNWAKINNHQDSDMMYIVAAIDPKAGIGGTVFSVNKTSDEVKKLGQLFDSNSDYAYSNADNWFFSYIQPTKMYILELNRFFTVDVLTKETVDIFDTTSLLAASYASQAYMSADEMTVSFTLRQRADNSIVGCAVYFIQNKTFALFNRPPFTTGYDSCPIDKSGRYLLFKANIDDQNDLDAVFVDLKTGKNVTMLDQDGAPGPKLDSGWNTLVAASDNFAPVACQFHRYDFKPIIENGFVLDNLTIVYNSDGWTMSGGCPSHLTWTNAKDPSIVSYDHQFLCGSQVDDASKQAKDNEIVCFRPDSSLDVLIVAPTMTFMNATGGSDTNDRYPRAVLDVTGDYILWSSNLRADRIDIFVVRVPWHFLVSEQAYRPPLPTPQSNSAPTTTGTPVATQQPSSPPKGVVATGSVPEINALVMNVVLLAVAFII